MFNYTNCPLCKGMAFEKFITCEDYTVSHERFNIVSCKNCGFKFTNPIPEISELFDYYKSEDYISHSDTKKGIISKLYHAVRNYTLKKKLGLIAKYVSRGTVLDYGCGTGAFLEVCKSAGWKTLGMEPDSGARRIANDKSLGVVENKNELAKEMKGEKLDVITLWHVLEHVTDLEETLSFFRDNLNKKGALIIAVPNHTSYDAKFYKEHWAAYDVPRHLYHFEPKTIQALLKEYGFELIKTQPMKFDSFYVSMLSEKYKAGSMSYFKAFLTGLKSNLKAKSPTGYSSVIYVFKSK
jgi:2-polyprenyl-3-methyl-5-hydroxy-6-metoxy-1,4-benzoquinol methylase